MKKIEQERKYWVDCEQQQALAEEDSNNCE